MSMRYSGRASRTFIMGIRLCPPLKILAASPCCSNKATASGSVPGRQYSNDWGIIFFAFPQKRGRRLLGPRKVYEKQLRRDLAAHRWANVLGVNEIDHYLRTKSAFSIGNWFEGRQT